MMKKTMMTIVLALMAMLSAGAQTLTGNWACEVPDEETGGGMVFLLAFEGNLMRQFVIGVSGMENVGAVTTIVTVPAQSYTPGSKVLDFKFDASQAEVILKDIEFDDDVKASFAANPKKEELLTETVEAMFKAKAKEMAENLLLSGKHTIGKVTKGSFVLTDEGGETYTFKDDNPQD
jgi:hypothetical protein